MSTNLIDSLSSMGNEGTSQSATGGHEESAVDLAVLQLVSSELGEDTSSAAHRDVDFAVPPKRQRRERLRCCAASNSCSPFWERAKQATALSLFVLSAVLAGTSLGIFWKQASEPALESVQTTVTNSSERSALATIAIEKVQLGDRLAGRNPLRDEVELSEPDPATWRSISLHLEKESGSELWVELLRPEVWLEWHDAKVGGTIDIDLPEMGAVGEALVTSIGPSPPIKPGTGTIVTGTFKHRADQNSQVIHLLLEDQQQPTGVTANHCYWSVDRREFVEAGHLRIGEQLDTEFGLKRVVSITPISHTGFLYNLETTEHVYRIDPLGTLVHNSCVVESSMQTLDLGKKGWRQSQFGLDGLVYVLKNSETGEVLKVGQTTANTFIGRFEKYVSAGNRNGVRLEVDVFEVPHASRGIIEGQVRKVMGAMHRLPWDNTIRRLGRPGSGIP